jgi:hypothetical protein
MKIGMNRREMVVLLGGVAGASGIATLLHADQAASPTKPAGMREVPWPCKPIDPDVAAQRAFDGYNKHHCMYGAFEAMVAPVADQLGRL